MSNTPKTARVTSLDEIRAKKADKFPSLELRDGDRRVLLRNVMRLDRDQREKVGENEEALNDLLIGKATAQTMNLIVDRMKQHLLLVADDEDMAAELLNELDDADITLLYNENSRKDDAGEA